MHTTYQLNELTDEIFGHLCNVALTKCSDKFEKKRAGCGGRAMRKRVLIKNFVSDLFKMEKKKPTASDEEYEEDFEMTDVSYYDDELEEEIQIDEYSSYEMHHSRVANEDCWLSHASVYQNESVYYDPYSTASSSIANSSSPQSAGSYAIYDVYSNVSEQATEGEMPSPSSDPLASISSIMQPSCESPTFDVYTNERFFQSHDDFFASGASQDVVYNLEQNFEETHELTDLDVATGESNKNKRRSAELFEEFNMCFQKRIKI